MQNVTYNITSSRGMPPGGNGGEMRLASEVASSYATPANLSYNSNRYAMFKTNGGYIGAFPAPPVLIAAPAGYSHDYLANPSANALFSTLKEYSVTDRPLASIRGGYQGEDPDDLVAKQKLQCNLLRSSGKSYSCM